MVLSQSSLHAKLIHGIIHLFLRLSRPSRVAGVCRLAKIAALEQWKVNIKAIFVLKRATVRRDWCQCLRQFVEACMRISLLCRRSAFVLVEIE